MQCNSIISIEVPAKRRGLLDRFLKRPSVQGPSDDEHVYVMTTQLNGCYDYHRIMGNGVADADLSATGGKLCRVGLGNYEFSPVFSNLVSDDQGHGWDLRITGQLSVVDSRHAMGSLGRRLAGPGSPVTSSVAESWIAEQIGPQVRDSVQGHSIADLRDRQALPPSWWEKQLSEWVGELGLAVHVDSISWSSAQADAAEAVAARRRDIERVARAREQERAAELRDLAAEAEYEKQREQIEADSAMSERERSHQLEIVEKRHRKEMIDADAEIEAARREAERASLEHEATMARLRGDAEAVLRVDRSGEEADERHLAIMAELDGLRFALEQMPGDLLAQLAGRDEGRANAAAERLVSPEFSVPASTLEGLGFKVVRQNLVKMLREKALADGAQTLISKSELRTRDLGGSKVKGLPVNTSLQFELSSQRGGYVTLLNIGTSGTVYLHVPNPYIGRDEAKIEAGRSYTVPGPELLPYERLDQVGLDYVEVGPPGWEHIGVLISDEPLVSDDVLARAVSDSPFSKLTDEDIADIGDTLAGLPDERWSGGVLSFLVE